MLLLSCLMAASSSSQIQIGKQITPNVHKGEKTYSVGQLEASGIPQSSLHTPASLPLKLYVSPPILHSTKMQKHHERKAQHSKKTKTCNRVPNYFFSSEITSFRFCSRSSMLNDGATPTVVLDLVVRADAAVLQQVKEQLQGQYISISSQKKILKKLSRPFRLTRLKAKP